MQGYLKWSLPCYTEYSLSRFADAIKLLNDDFESILKLPVEIQTNEQIIRSYGKTAPDYNADIVGDYIKNDADNIIELLNDSKCKCRHIAIFGMVGIGKTTLARTIYHNVKTGRGDTDFEIKLWIRFSKDLSSLIIWSDSRKEGPTKAQLLQLGKKIANKKFLLVVDGVWTENVWETFLEGPLQQGDRERSKVIITTRNKHVAKRFGAGHVHHMKRMSNSDAWKLLCQRASLSQADADELKDIGKQIVKKCDGLPLAIRCIGRTLRGQEPTRHDWEKINRTAFQDLSPEEQYIINMSFQDLPSHMRQCFLYCSIFPEDFLMERQYIIEQWISEGFIHKKRKSNLEEAAESCYYELIGRGLLYLHFREDGLVGAKMPFIIRSFIKDVSDNENFCNESVSTENLFNARRLSVVGDNTVIVNGSEIAEHDSGANTTAEPAVGNNNGTDDEFSSSDSESRIDATTFVGKSLRGLGAMKRLRTLVLRKSTVPDGILEDAFKQLTLLRVVDLREAMGITILPATVGRLLFLKYLNISDTNIKKLPWSIQNLRLLQYLLLSNCKLIQPLPKGIGRLTNLRTLDISGTGLTNTNWSFAEMDELISMHGFPLGSYGSLKSLNLNTPKKLDSLRIEKLENVLDPPSGSPLKKFELKDLELCYSNDPTTTSGENLDKEMRVLNEFCPHKRLISLKIENYTGRQYPLWISRHDALLNLQRLHLRSCSLCDKLPQLGNLPQLKFLSVTGFAKLEKVGAELRGDRGTKPAFCRLQQLHVGNMKALQKWSALQPQDLPCLQVLRLLSCSKLAMIPDTLQTSTSLTRLEVDTTTMILMKGQLEKFADGIVFNVDNPWLWPTDRPQDRTTSSPHSQSHNCVVHTALSHPITQQQIEHEPMANPSLHTNGRYHSWRSLTVVIPDIDNKAALYVLIALSLSIVMYLLYLSCLAIQSFYFKK